MEKFILSIQTEYLEILALTFIWIPLYFIKKGYDFLLAYILIEIPFNKKIRELNSDNKKKSEFDSILHLEKQISIIDKDFAKVLNNSKYPIFIDEGKIKSLADKILASKELELAFKMAESQNQLLKFEGYMRLCHDPLLKDEDYINFVIENMNQLNDELLMNVVVSSNVRVHKNKYWEKFSTALSARNFKGKEASLINLTISNHKDASLIKI